ncbi:membrane protein [Mesorhizobium sp. LSJC269B00]|nr:membrane protein [Mesorhizobium sp. LSJC269B00]
MILYKLGLFGIDWDHTPFMDNKASFQRGINQAVRRTSTELADNLGRVRTTSQIDTDLQDARGNLQFDEGTWYFGLNPFGPKTPTPSYYRDAVRKLRSFNARLATCQATFDARADNLKQYIDRISSDIGSTSAILKERAENHNNGWFDFRADDRFWFSYGQLYAYYGLMKGAQADFEDVIKEKHLQNLWDTMDAQFVSALRIRPLIIANGREDGWLLPNHLTTIGFYMLRVRSNMIEISNVIAQ